MVLRGGAAILAAPPALILQAKGLQVVVQPGVDVGEGVGPGRVLWILLDPRLVLPGGFGGGP